MNILGKIREFFQPKRVAYVQTGKSISLNLDGRQFTISSSHPNYVDIRERLASGQTDGLLALIDVPVAIATFTQGRVQVMDNDTILIDGNEVSSAITERIIKLLREGEDFKPLVRFLDKVQENPLQSARDELWLFMERNGLPLFEDGDFGAYKKVRADYLDCHSGTFDNSPGRIVSIPRDQVDPNRYNTCSYGLHFCSKGYLSHFGGERVVLVKINPKDVVAIPNDYNNAKGRTCRYEVIEDITAKLDDEYERDAYTNSVYRKIEDDTGEPRDWHVRVVALTIDGEYAVRTVTVSASSVRLAKLKAGEEARADLSYRTWATRNDIDEGTIRVMEAVDAATVVTEPELPEIEVGDADPDPDAHEGLVDQDPFVTEDGDPEHVEGYLEEEWEDDLDDISEDEDLDLDREDTADERFANYDFGPSYLVLDHEPWEKDGVKWTKKVYLDDVLVQDGTKFEAELSILFDEGSAEIVAIGHSVKIEGDKTTEENRQILEAVREHGSINKAAKALGIARSTAQKRYKRATS